MVEGKIYKHVKNTEIALQVHTIANEANIIKVEGVWWNIVNKDNMYIIDFDEVQINVDDVKNWEELK